jgi:hypothetical protein
MPTKRTLVAFVQLAETMLADSDIDQLEYQFGLLASRPTRPKPNTTIFPRRI